MYMCVCIETKNLKKKLAIKIAPVKSGWSSLDFVWSI